MSLEIQSPIVGSIILFVISIILFIVAGFMLYKTFKYSGKTSGTIISSDFYDTYTTSRSTTKIGKFISFQDRTTKPRYKISVKFTVKDKEYTTSTIVTYKYNINDKINVNYDPSDPSNSEIVVSFIKPEYVFLAIGCSTFILSIGSLIYHAFSD